MNSGCFIPARPALILSMATFSVPVTFWLAALLKPIWLSLICTNEKSSTIFFFPEFVISASTFEVGTPATIDQTSPVPAHAMHCRKLRRSMPSPATFGSFVSCVLCFISILCFIVTTSAAENWPHGLLFPGTRKIIPNFYVCYECPLQGGLE